ncbi:outer membrane beta-barrel protein [Acidovorax sp. NCPPB 2350]|nr:outer membrane beta-barrel protein [Acidovorax sp. NCPPB 2350]
MQKQKHPVRLLSCAIALACGAVAVHAQTSSRNSVIPSTEQGYLGLSGGKSKYDLRSGTGNFNFDDSDTAWKLYTGGYFNPNFGVEFGYLNFGSAHRIGGETKAQGLNLSLVGRAPIGTQFDVFGKVGTTYGRTKTSGNPGFGVATGNDNGFGLSFGGGLRWAFNPQWAAVVEWERHRLHFADGKSDVDMTTLGVQYRY